MEEYLESFYLDCRVRNLTSKTMQGYQERLENFHRFFKSKGVTFDQVDLNTIQTYILSMKDRVSDYTVNGRIRVL
jgi:site-specific recombinase XerD